MSSSQKLQEVGTFVIPPYRPEFEFNLAKSIDQVVYCKQHSLDRINTQDVMYFAECKERLRCYRPMNQSAYRMFINLAGRHFSLSPRQLKTELPLMILTDTETIFERRIRKLKKLQKQSISQQNSDSNSQAEITFSHSSSLESTSSLLTSNISHKSFSDLLSQVTNAVSMGSWADIYNLSYSLNEKDVNSNLRAIQQTIKESTLRMKLITKIDQEVKQLINNIKTASESQINHLICNYEDQEKHQISINSKKQQQAKVILRKKSSEKSKSWKQLHIDSQPNVEEQDLMMQLPEQIQYKLEKQLHKYKINANPFSISSSSTNKSKKKVIEKAQQMLRSLGVHF